MIPGGLPDAAPHQGARFGQRYPTKCWLRHCTETVDPFDDLGLCPKCADWLRDEKQSMADLERT